MSAEDVKKFLSMIVMKANASEDAKKQIAEWVKHYPGKIIQIETDGEIYHVVITKKGLKLREGEYPSPDLIFRAPSEVLMSIFTGRKTMKDAMKNWEMLVIGAAHDGIPMAKLITTVLMGM
ncbi:MAG: SCP2 sterol-binding domain-containing protein [Candidatus Methanofastidiosia archaeon]